MKNSFVTECNGSKFETIICICKDTSEIEITVYLLPTRWYQWLLCTISDFFDDKYYCRIDTITFDRDHFGMCPSAGEVFNTAKDFTNHAIDYYFEKKEREKNRKNLAKDLDKLLKL